MSGYKEIAPRESCFRPGSTLCPGCMESVAFQNIGRVIGQRHQDHLHDRHLVRRGLDAGLPERGGVGPRRRSRRTTSRKSFAILHNVFESAPTLAEAVRDVADVLTDVRRARRSRCR